MSDVRTPEWVKHAVFYQIFPDRFAKSPHLTKPRNLEPWDSEPTTFGYKGGDLLGIVEHLDYLQELGVTALYFNPIFQSASNHRYHTHDYFQVDPLLGGNAAFDTLLAECKRRNLRVVLDGVFNHASRGFFQFNDILENGAASPWIDWFFFDAHPANAYDHNRPPGYKAWVGLHALPKFNTDNEQVREFLMQVGEHWIRQGIDGWRLDVAEEITTPGFWQEFRQRIKAINPEAYIVAEIWHESQEWLQGDQFDAVMNYPLTEALISFTIGHRLQREQIGDRGYSPQPGISAHAFADRLDRLFNLYPWQIQLTQLNLLDSHDTARFLTLAGNDLASVQLATLLLFALPGAPSIYYGDEIGLTGGRTDAAARTTFPWEHPERWNQELLAWYKQVIVLRQSLPALQTGSYHRLYADGDAYAFGRQLDGSTLVVAVNVGETPCDFKIPVHDAITFGSTPHVIFGKSGAVEVGGDGLHLTILARSSVIVDMS